MNVLSLFSGIGGLDLGLERAGMTVVGQVEIDPFCQWVLAKHWPEVPRHDDVRTAVQWWLGEPRPAVDVVCGGFPCQPVSNAGKRLAQADARWLWPSAWTVIRELRPAWAVLENVPGLLGRGMGDVLGDMAEGGYDAQWDCVPAAAIGAPHRRDRVFVVAYPSGQSVAGNHRENGNVADSSINGRGTWWSGRLAGGRTHGPVISPSGLVADPDRQARGPEAGHAITENGGGPDAVGSSQPGRCGGVGHAHGSRREPWAWLDWSRPATVGTGWWATEPDVGRVAHGVPARVDRLRGLGNAVVPQVAEHIGRLVMAGVS